jgi:hypothetical protein
MQTTSFLISVFMGILIGSMWTDARIKQYIVDQGKAEWVIKQNGAVEFRWK